MRRRWSITAAVLSIGSAALPVHAQEIGGPVMGLVVERATNLVRPVLGVPGAAITGTAIEPGDELSVIETSPKGDYVLVSSDASGETSLWMTDGAVRPIGGLRPGARLMALSPSGSAAIFLDASANRISAWSGLPDNPVQSSEFDVSGFSAPYAISDDGGLLLAASGSAALVLRASGESVRIPLPAGPAAMAFAPASHDALVGAGSEAEWIAHADAPAAPLRLTAPGLGSIASVAVAGDRRQAIAAGAAGGVAIFDLASGDLRLLTDCHCAPQALFRMNQSGLVRIGGSDDQKVLLIDTNTASPRLLTVHAAPGTLSKP